MLYFTREPRNAVKYSVAWRVAERVAVRFAVDLHATQIEKEIQVPSKMYIWAVVWRVEACLAHFEGASEISLHAVLAEELQNLKD